MEKNTIKNYWYFVLLGVAFEFSHESSLLLFLKEKIENKMLYVKGWFPVTASLQKILPYKACFPVILHFSKLYFFAKLASSDYLRKLEEQDLDSRLGS